MKAYYKTVLMGDRVGSSWVYQGKKREDVYEHRLLEMTEPCCEEMEEALGDGAIGFGEFHDCILNKDININFRGPWNSYYGITHCPFCGEKVETEERERVTLKKVVRHLVATTKEDYEETSPE